MSYAPFDPDALKRIQESISIVTPDQVRRIQESIQIIPPDELKRIQAALPTADELKRIQESVRFIGSDEMKQIQATLPVVGGELKRLQESMRIIEPDELKRIQAALSLKVGGMSALSGVAFAGAPAPAAAAVSEFEDLIDTEDSDTTLWDWLDGLAPQVRPSVFVNAVWALVATIEYIQVELGAEPSPSMLFLVGSLMAIAMFLASLEDAP